MTVVDLVSAKQKELDAVEASLPAHMMFLMMEECQKIGLDMRADTLHRLNVAAASPFAKLETFAARRAAQKADDVARSLLTMMSPDDPRDGLYASAMFALTLVDEGFIRDPQNMAVLVALLLMDDLKDDRPDDKGQGAIWHLKEREWRKVAGNMHVRAALQGVYTTRKA